jgi:hypothetical protein
MRKPSRNATIKARHSAAFNTVLRKPKQERTKPAFARIYSR